MIASKKSGLEIPDFLDAIINSGRVEEV